MEAMTKQHSSKPWVFGLFFFLILYLLWLMARPMIGALIFGCILAGLFFPFNGKLQEKFKVSRNFAAGLTSSLIFLVVLLPTCFLIFSLSKEAVNLYQSLASGFNQNEVNNFLFGEGFVARIIKQVSETFDVPINLMDLRSNLLDLIQRASGNIIGFANGLLGNIVGLLWSMIIMMIAIFGLLTEGDKLKEYIFQLSPLPRDQEETILSKFNQMNYVTLVCNGLGGLLQGVLGGIALAIVGVHSVLLWTVVMIILAFIPLVGISFVTVPASIYLILTGRVIAGLLLFTFTGTMALIVENWFKPRFIGGRIQINSVFVLLTIIGGMSVFGAAGIFYGPIIGILFLTLVEIYHKHYSLDD